ncbi:hypothetical protein ACFWZ0_28590 [[Kitasatospora] papulosa]
MWANRGAGATRVWMPPE